MKKIVILTGSFNPITKAHRVLLDSVVEKIGADEGLFVITNDAYLTKKNLVDNKTPNPFHLNEETREKIINALTAEFPKLKFGGHELGNESPSTERTLNAIAKQHRGDELYFMSGADKLKGIQNWKNIDKILENYGLIVFKREGIDVDKIINESKFFSDNRNKIQIFEQTEDTSGISSTLVRKKFFAGEDYSDLMDNGPYSIMSQFKPEDFPKVSEEDVIKATINYGGRFGGNAARIKVYNDNKKIFNNWDSNLLGDRNEKLDKTKVYKQEFNFSPVKTDCETIYDCVNADCADVAEKLLKDGFNPCIHNLASNICPCGGYDKGSSAQEESLCYMSTLSQSLYQFGNIKLKKIKDAGVKNYPDTYPLNVNFGGIYSPNVTFFRNNIDKYYSLRNNVFSCGIVTVASLSNREKNDYTNDERKYFNNEDDLNGTLIGTLNKEGLVIEKNKIRTVLRIALDNKHDSIVLGAFGCGVYNLLPAEISRLFKDILEEDEFKNQFKKVVFAIYEGKGSSRKIVGENGKFKPFYDIFKKR